MEFSGLDIDHITSKIIKNRYLGIESQEIPEKELWYLVQTAEAQIAHDPILLDLASPITIVGTTDGDSHSLLTIFEYGGLPPDVRYLFLGNFIGDHKDNLPSLLLLLSFKIKYPQHIYFLKGKNEWMLTDVKNIFFYEC